MPDPLQPASFGNKCLKIHGISNHSPGKKGRQLTKCTCQSDNHHHKALQHLLACRSKSSQHLRGVALVPGLKT